MEDINTQIQQLEQELDNLYILEESEQSIYRRNILNHINDLKRQKRNNNNNNNNSSKHQQQPKQYTSRQLSEKQIKQLIEQSPVKLDSHELLVTRRRGNTILSSSKTRNFDIASKLSSTLKFGKLIEKSRIIEMKRPGNFTIHQWKLDFVINPLIIEGTSLVDTRNSFDRKVDEQKIGGRPGAFFGEFMLTDGCSFRMKLGEPDTWPASVMENVNIAKTEDPPKNVRVFEAEHESDDCRGAFIYDTDMLRIHYYVRDDPCDDENQIGMDYVGPLFITLEIPYHSTKGTGYWWRPLINKTWDTIIFNPGECSLAETMDHLFPNGSLDRYRKSFSLRRDEWNNIAEQGTCEVTVKNLVVNE
jgi:hypothetical protein